MGYIHVPTIQFLVGRDKVSEEARYQRGVKVEHHAPQSPLCQKHADLAAAVAEVSADTTELKDKMDAFAIAEAAFKAARTALGTAVIKWDGSYDVFVSTGEKYAATEHDAATLGAEARGKTINPLVMPISVEFEWNPDKDELRVHVHRAPGMRVVTVQVSPDPITATSWFELEGSGAIHVIPHPAKGTWWARAQSRTARARSDFTSPVSAIVR
jgi:hypothetical protein